MQRDNIMQAQEYKDLKVEIKETQKSINARIQDILAVDQELKDLQNKLKSSIGERRQSQVSDSNRTFSFVSE